MLGSLRLRRKAAREDGFVMVMALLMTVVILLLAGAIISASMTASDHAARESSRSTAVAAANAGLQAAVHRLSSQAEETTTQQAECFTTTFSPPTAGKCKETTNEEMSSGVSFRYAISPMLEENKCTGAWVEASSGHTITQRCITAIGEANGITARAQERVANLKGWGLFPVNGIFSFSNLTFINEVEYSGELGSDGNFEFVNNVNQKGGGPITVRYGGTYTSKKASACCTTEKISKEELESTRFKAPTQSASGYEAALKSNSDEKLVPSGYYNAATHELTDTSKTLFFPKGVYYFCKIEATASEAKIEYEPGVEVYLDSKYRSGSPCTTEGTLTVGNKSNFADNAASPKGSDFKLFAWGRPPETSETKSPKLKFTNTVTGPMYMEIYAPYSFVEFVNEVEMGGTILGGAVKFTNKVKFKGEKSSGSSGSSGGLTFFPTAYHVCTPSSEYSASGCY